MTHLNGHLLYALPEGEYATATSWLERQGILALVAEAVSTWQQDGDETVDALFDKVESRFVEAWQNDAGLETTARPSPTCSSSMSGRASRST